MFKINYLWNFQAIWYTYRNEWVWNDIPPLRKKFILDFDDTAVVVTTTYTATVSKHNETNWLVTFHSVVCFVNDGHVDVCEQIT